MDEGVPKIGGGHMQKLEFHFVGDSNKVLALLVAGSSQFVS